MTVEESFFNAKAELERGITAQLKDFANKYRTSVFFKGNVEVQCVMEQSGKMLQATITHIEVETKVSQG